jgi:uncharacterized repeat protein (TIGR03803 family)
MEHLPEAVMKLDFRAGLFGVFTIFGIVGASPRADAGAPTAIYSFPGGNAGNGPAGELVADPAGNLYGVTYYGGPKNSGVVFELSPPAAPSTAWTETVLYEFSLVSNGLEPRAGLVLDSGGNLYGTTIAGGCNGCGGTAFRLSPPAKGSTTWTYSVIYEFRPVDGTQPPAKMIFDSSGNLYGTTYAGGMHPGCCGVAFELSPARVGPRALDRNPAPRLHRRERRQLS